MAGFRVARPQMEEQVVPGLALAQHLWVVTLCWQSYAGLHERPAALWASSVDTATLMLPICQASRDLSHEGHTIQLNSHRKWLPVQVNNRRSKFIIRFDVKW